MASVYELQQAIQGLRAEMTQALELIRAQRQLLEAAQATIARQAERITELEDLEKKVVGVFEEVASAKPDA